jgi:hypothetical protein
LDKLASTPPGAIEGTTKDTILGLLVNCWSELEGAEQTSMAAHKLDRAEDLSWKPPELSFRIERHGATVLGSTRAELQNWTVNLNRGTANCEQGSYRQLTPIAPRLDVKSIVDRVYETVQQGPLSDSELVKKGIVVWNGDKQVAIKHGLLIPSGAHARTVAGRRQRFRKELTAKMGSFGWRLVPSHRTMNFCRC